MGNIFNDDFRDFIKSMHEFQVKYILIGGYSVILHGYSRTTGDMDIWVQRTEENYRRLQQAFLHFGMPVFDMTLQNFLNHPDWEVFTFGKPPSSIDVMVKVKGLEFNECYSAAVWFDEDGLAIRTIDIANLINAKKASARSKDLDDLENLSQYS